MVYKQQWQYSNSADKSNQKIALYSCHHHYHYQHHTSIQVDEVAPQFSNGRSDARIDTIFGIVYLVLFLRANRLV